MNLEHVSSPSERLHDAFLASLGYSRDTEDDSSILLNVGTQHDMILSLIHISEPTRPY